MGEDLGPRLLEYLRAALRNPRVDFAEPLVPVSGGFDDLLAPGATSLMSFRHVEKWPSIPRESLVEALAGKQRTLIRSDKIPASGGGISRNGNLWVELAVPVRR